MPHLRSLVERYQDQPFELIGINTNDSPEAYEEGVEEYELTWLSAYQGVGQSPISDLYKVRGYPTYIVIDTEGKIVGRAHGTDDELIAKLVKEAAAKEDGDK